MSENDNPLQYMDRDELIRHIEDLQEQLRMSQAFADTGESDGSNSKDATLFWRGRKRFLTERIIPVKLEPSEGDSYQADKGPHRIIDGDNLSVMTSLLTEFRGGPNKGFDVIYMDPPYNTGNDVFSYNDNYSFSKSEINERIRTVPSLVSLDDPTRHTKWINHMAPRLWAARKLLKFTGVIIISIDEHELPRLWMLMEEIFGEKNRIATLIWERSRKNDAKYVSEGHEYMLVWARDCDALDAKMAEMALTPQWISDKGKWRKKKTGADVILTAYAEAKREHGNDIESIQKALDIFFSELPKDHPAHSIRYKKVDAIGVYNDDGNLNWPGGGGPRYDIPHPTTGKPVKVPKSGWRFTEENILALIEQGRIAFKKDHTGVPRLITYLHEMETEVQTSVIAKSGQRAVEVVEAIIGKGVIKNPKDHEMLAELFNLVTWRNSSAAILDPYAGSGTTGHAVLSMNLEDNGRRRFVLIEHNTLKPDYTSQVTAERVRRFINGKWIDESHHTPLGTGYHFYHAREEITRQSLMSSTRESLADIILQVVEDDSNKIDYRFKDYTYLIGRTRNGYGIALVWGTHEGDPTGRTLTWDIRNQILDEAEQAKVSRPIYIYASVNSAPLNNELYRFCQIPNWILARLGMMDEDYNDETDNTF